MINSWRTAIARKAPSLPARLLHEHDQLKGRLLDYGCGKGMDADTYGMDRYDPYYHPQFPKGKYDTVLCTYVLNVVSEEVGFRILRRFEDRLLKKSGLAFVTVRADIKEDTQTQRVVHLNRPLFYENSKFRIYVIAR